MNKQSKHFYLFFFEKKKWTDIDECSVNNGGCHVNANCTNSIGNFSCTCQEGYSGNGFSCEGIHFSSSSFFHNKLKIEKKKLKKKKKKRYQWMFNK